MESNLKQYDHPELYAMFLAGDSTVAIAKKTGIDKPEVGFALQYWMRTHRAEYKLRIANMEAHKAAERERCDAKKRLKLRAQMPPVAADARRQYIERTFGPASVAEFMEA